MKKLFVFILLSLGLAACSVDYHYDDCDYYYDHHYCHDNDPTIYYDYNEYEIYYSDWYGFEPYNDQCYATPWEGNGKNLYCDSIYCFDPDHHKWKLKDIVCY